MLDLKVGEKVLASGALVGVGFRPAASAAAPSGCTHKFTLATLGTPSGVGGGRLGWCVRCGEAATYNPMTNTYTQ